MPKASFEPQAGLWYFLLLSMIIVLKKYLFSSFILVAIFFVGCKDGTTSPNSLPKRTFRMGFSAIPPRADINILVASVNMWSQRADAAIMSYELPWDSLLDGVPAESVAARNLSGLANYFRAKGHQLWLYIDPANGLNRSGEADALVRRGRSITEPAVQLLYRRWVVVSDSIVHPEHLGLALETNLIRGASSPALYSAIRQAVNDAAVDVRSRGTTAKLSVSIQVDYAWGAFGSSYLGIDTDFVHFPFIEELGLSSYPYLAGYTDPDSVPFNYYSRLIEGRTIPTMVTEGGWTSVSLGGIISSPETQRRYIVRHMHLLDSVRAIAVFQLTFTDLDLAVYPPSVGPFAYLGLVDINLNPKPALWAWDETFSRPRY